MVDKNKLVSVIVPTYNRASLIVDALNSIYKQSYRPLEIIVVDDGSTDDTETVVQNWIDECNQDKDLCVRYIYQENKGGNPARNQGIKESSGDFVAFLDSDDLWHLDKIEKQMAVFENDRDIGGVYCGLQQVLIHEKEQLIETASPRDYPSGDLIQQMLIHDVTAPTSTYIIRSQVFEQVGVFDEDLLARQDWDMWIRLASYTKIGVVPEILVDYRVHGGIRTASNPQKEIDAYKTIVKKYAHLRKQCPFNVRQAAKASFYRRIGRVYFHHQISIVQAFKYQILAIINWPFVFDSYAALLGMLLPRDSRRSLHLIWNKFFGATFLAIKSH